MTLTPFSVSSGIATGRSDKCCSWFADEATECLGRNEPPLGSTKRLREIWVPGGICPVTAEVDKGRDEQIRRHQGGRLSQRLHRCMGGWIRLTRTSWPEGSVKNSGCESLGSSKHRKTRSEPYFTSGLGGDMTGTLAGCCENYRTREQSLFSVI